MSKIVELGCAGHLIVARDCHFRRHTQIGDSYRVSTVGEYWPPHKDKRDTIGAGDDSFFETMVFKTTSKQCKDNEGCGCHEVADWCEIDCERYATAGKAQAGHQRYVKKYSRRK
jgi:hypothetical protein